MNNAVAELARALAGGFKGDLLLPGDPQFDAACGIWNARAARTPGLIARCADAADVASAVRRASSLGVLTAVRCGGHSLAGFGSCDGGLVIDLSRMRRVSVDPIARRARAEGGCLLGNVDVATQGAGLVFPSGVVSLTGAGGLILGGGTGWLTRIFGLSCDNVESYTLVAASGDLLRASAKENRDLYWALRGGGGNFGVVTEFELRLHPLTHVTLANAWWLDDDILPVVQRWRDFMPGAPDELKWNLSLRLAPPLSGIPAPARGKPALNGTALWVGGLKQGQSFLDHIASLGHPVAVTQETISFLTLQTMADADFPHGRRYYTKSGFFLTLTGDSIERMAAALPAIPSPNTQIEMAYLGGACGRVGASETAFGDRSAPFIMNLLADWPAAEGDSANVQWVRDLFTALRPAMRPEVYINFMSGDEADRVQEAYHDRWDRLVAVKTRFDPSNFFRVNQNIPPALPKT